MADVAIIRSADKETAAARLAESLTAAGYDLAAVDVGEPGGLVEAVEACTADAVILIWSRSLVFHVLHSGELPRIRQVRNLIEVSADGITPPSRVDDSRVILISGWRGQPFHPGWQRLQAELKGMCGSPRGGAETPRAAIAIASNPGPQTGAPPASGGRARVPLRPILGGAAALAAVGAALGAVSWSGGRAPDDRPRQEAAQPRTVVPAVTGAPVEGRTEPAAGTVEASPPPLPDPAPEIQVAKPAASKPQPKPSPARLALRPARPDAGDSAAASVQAAGGKKYSRKNSKIMRQFCERSGRSTPQCRTFLRSVGAP